MEIYHYCPQTKLAKVMFLQVSVSPQGGVCMVVPGGACLVAPGGMHGCSGGHAWLLWGVCMVAWGVVLGCSWGGGHAWDTTRYRDTVNERAVRILLECILVYIGVYWVRVCDFRTCVKKVFDSWRYVISEHRIFQVLHQRWMSGNV